MAGSISKSTHKCSLEREVIFRMRHMTGICVVYTKQKHKQRGTQAKIKVASSPNNSLGAYLIITRGDQAEARVGRTRQISKIDIVAEQGPACQTRGIVPFWGGM